VACRVLGVSRSGYYEWLSRPASTRQQENELLLKHIERIYGESRGAYGWPRVHAELTIGLELAVNHKRVARLMRAAGLQGLYRRRSRRSAPAGDRGRPGRPPVRRGGAGSFVVHRYHRA